MVFFSFMVLQLFPVMVLYLCTEIGTEHLRDYIMNNIKFKLHSDYIKAIVEFNKVAKKSKDRFYGMVKDGHFYLYGNYSVMGVNVEVFENNSEYKNVRISPEMIEMMGEFVKSEKIRHDMVEFCFNIISYETEKMCVDMILSYENNLSKKFYVNPKFEYNMLAIRCTEPKDVQPANFDCLGVNFKLIADAMKIIGDLSMTTGLNFDSSKSEVAWLRFENSIIKEDGFNFGILPLKQ